MKKLKSLLFTAGRILSVVFACYYVVIVLITLFSGVRYQFVHHPLWVAFPLVSGTIGLFVGYSVYFINSLRKSKKEYKAAMEAEKEKEEAQDGE